MTTIEVAEALKEGEPPNVVVLAGCKSGDMLGSIVAAGVPVAFGFTENIPFADGSGATNALLTSLLKGDSLVQAMGAANDWMDAHSTLFNQARATMMVAPGIDVNLGLKDIHQ